MVDVSSLYKRAEDAFKKRSYDYARDLFVQILALDPNHGNSRRALYATMVTKYKEQGAPSKLAMMAKKAQIEIQLQTAKSNPQKKIDACQKYLLDDPNNSRIRTFLAEALRDLNHFDGGAIEAEVALQVDPNNVQAAKILAFCFKELGKIKEAQETLARVEHRATEDRELSKLIRDLAATETTRRGFETATSYRDIIRDKDKAADLERQTHLVQSEDEIVRILAVMEEEIAKNPSDAKLWKKKGDFLFDKRKDYASAREVYRKASELAPQDSVLKDRGDDCSIRLFDLQIEKAQKSNDPRASELKANKLRLEIQSFERRTADRPTDMTLRFELGKRYFQAGPNYLDKAVVEFQQSVRDPKKKMESHVYLGACFWKKKLYDLADTQYQKAEEAGIIAQTQLLNVWYNRARLNSEAGNLALALELGKKIMGVDIGYQDISELVTKWQSK